MCPQWKSFLELSQKPTPVHNSIFIRFQSEIQVCETFFQVLYVHIKEHKNVLNFLHITKGVNQNRCVTIRNSSKSSTIPRKMECKILHWALETWPNVSTSSTKNKWDRETQRDNCRPKKFHVYRPPQSSYWSNTWWEWIIKRIKRIPFPELYPPERSSMGIY